MSTPMATDQPYRNACQQRLLAVQRTLFDAPIGGVTLAHVAQVTSSSKSQALRDLSNLALARFAEKTDDGRWRPSSAFVALAVQAQTALARAEARLADMRSAMDVARYT